jgi:hypothetical protein
MIDFTEPIGKYKANIRIKIDNQILCYKDAIVLNDEGKLLVFIDNKTGRKRVYQKELVYTLDEVPDANIDTEIHLNKNKSSWG